MCCLPAVLHSTVSDQSPNSKLGGETELACLTFDAAPDRDLLKRHYATYHEAGDPAEPLRAGAPTVAGRTLIACQNCASAKTGCDKGVPCGRCTEKNLPCEARFTRRSYKTAIRAAPGSVVCHNPTGELQPQQALLAPGGANSPGMDPNQVGVESKCSRTPPPLEIAITGLPAPKGSPTETPLPLPPQMIPNDLPPPHLDDFTYMGNGFAPQDVAYQDIMLWPEFSMPPEVYPDPMPLDKTHADIQMPVFSGLDNIPSPSDAPGASSSSSRDSARTPDTSVMSRGDIGNALPPIELAMAAPTDNSIPDFEAVIMAETAWNLARCNPPPAAGNWNCPRTAILHLECLEQKSKQDGTWIALEKYLEQLAWDPSDLTSVVPLTSRTRDKMLAITQSFLHKALEVHRRSLSTYDTQSGKSSSGDFNFLVLPSAKIIEDLLRSYIRSLAVYYPLVSAGCVDPNEMLQNNQASTLLVLLTIAQGAATIPIAEARYLSAGLTETCRISLFDIVEKDIELSTDPTTLRCALLFIVLGSWSGDKWLMDIAIRQRGMYMSVRIGLRDYSCLCANDPPLIAS